MFELRMHTVMGRSAVSLWCRSHGDPHCLWSAQQWRDGDEPERQLEDLAGAALTVARLALQGSLEDLSDDCGL